MIKVIDEVKQNIKSQSISSKSQIELDSYEFYDGDEIKKFTHTLVSLRLPCANPYSISWVGDTIVCCSGNGDTYLKIGEKFELLGRINVLKKTLFSNIIIDGNNYLLIIDGAKKAYRVKNGMMVEIGEIDAEQVCNNGEILFFSKGRKVTFSAFNDMTDFSLEANKGGEFTIEDGYGDIVALATENKNLIIFTKKAIFEFCAIGYHSEYTLRRIECDLLDIYADSVKDMGDKIVFVSNDCIYSYKNGKVYLEESFLKDMGYNIVGYPALCEKIYYIPIMSGGIACLFRYNFNNKKRHLIERLSSQLFDGKYPVYKDNKLYEITLKSVEKKPVFSIGKISNNLVKKTIVKVIAYVVGSAKLVISGEEGSRELQLKDGLNEKKIRLQAVNFSMEIIDKSSDFELCEMQVKYKTKGE